MFETPLLGSMVSLEDYKKVTKIFYNLLYPESAVALGTLLPKRTKCNKTVIILNYDMQKSNSSVSAAVLRDYKGDECSKSMLTSLTEYETI